MQHDVGVLLALAHDRQAREREVAALRRRETHPPRSWRARLGLVLIRAGRRLAPEATSTPAWSA